MQDLSAVPDEVLLALVSSAGSDRMAFSAINRFGDRAIRPLVQVPAASQAFVTGKIQRVPGAVRRF
jgi:hypothetical protein